MNEIRDGGRKEPPSAFGETVKTASICWDCQKAIGKCSWSDYDEQSPVKGWEAEKTVIKGGYKNMEYSYRVISCPEFVRDIPRKV